MSGDGQRRKCWPAHCLTFILQGERSIVFRKIPTMFSLAKSYCSSGILFVLCKKELKTLEFGISMVSSLLFYFPPFLVTKFREVLNEEDNLAFKIKLYLCIK